MKLFEKIRRFIRGADRAVTNAICEHLDNTAEKLENFARNLDPEAFQESKMRESWEGRPKTDPETAARLAQMEKVRRMVEERADDVYHFEFNAYRDDVKKVQEMLIESFDTQNPQPYSVPVDSQEDIRKVKAYGGNPVVVPAGVAKLLKEEKDKRIKTLTEIPCANVMTLKDKFNRWYDVYAEDIRDEARMEIRNLIDELE